MIRTVFAIASAAAIALGVTVAVAQQDVIKERKDLMKANGAQAKIGADMVKGDKPFDAAAVHKMFAQFQDAAAKMPDLYPASSKDESGSPAADKYSPTDKVWSDTADFKSRFDKFGADAKVQVLLHPPVLRALGLNRKIRLGRSAIPLFKALRSGRRVRGTRLDPFGQAAIRRLESMYAIVFSFAVAYIAHRGVIGSTGVSIAINVIQISALIVFSIMCISYRVKHAPGSVVSGRIVDVTEGLARVELGEGLEGNCRIASESGAGQAPSGEGKVDLSSLSSMLKARWTGGPSNIAAKPEGIRPGQIRSFRIKPLEADSRKIDLEVV